MTKRYFLAAVVTASASLGAYALPSGFFAPRSVLSEGTWVKVGVEQTGVYEISYETLRRMGFSDPAQVAVYGRGGRMMPENFMSATGEILVSDDLSPVRVMHLNDKIYFYGLGVDQYTFMPDPNMETGGRFVNQGKNIYSRTGYYFLTDSAPGAKIETMSLPPSMRAGATEVSQGVGLLYHEDDLEHNASSTGKLFWGERFNRMNPTEYRWDVEMPDLIKGVPATMECSYYCERKLPSGSAWVEFGIENAGATGQITVKDTSTIAYVPQEPAVQSIGTGSSTAAKVFVKAEPGTGNDTGTACLDYWAITYPKGVPSLRAADGTRMSQDLWTIPSCDPTYTFSMPDAVGKYVLDVSDPLNPVNIQLEMDGIKGTALAGTSVTSPTLAVFDTSRPQLQICGYEEGYRMVGNQNLHAMAAEMPELAIIALPHLRPQAEAIAALHREIEGISVVVADCEEVYNEFSGGVPDPMAYRAFAKMLYDTGNGTLRNLMLIGPVFGDARGVNVERDLTQGFIAYQADYCSSEKGAFNINFFYGMMADYLPNLSNNPEKETIDIGVGILPCYFTDEADRYVDKLRRFLTRGEDHIYTLGHRLFIGGTQDNHTHDQQSIDLAAYANNVGFNSLLISQLPVNAYGYDKARAKMMADFNRGIEMATYIGHGACQFLLTNPYFFSNPHVREMRNVYTPFMNFAGCIISNCDRAQRGIGEAMVLDTDYGIIGALLATRDTWSGQNLELMKQLNTALCRDFSKLTTGYHDTPLTIGEVIANTMTVSLYANESAYQLIGDPAIRLPMVLRSATWSDFDSGIVPGTTARYQGAVTRDNGTPDTSFNGVAIARLIEPEVISQSEDLCVTENSRLTVAYRDTQITMGMGEVRNGKFDISIDIPATAARFDGQTAYVYVTAYDPSTSVGMAGCIPVSVSIQETGGVSGTADSESPVIDVMDFDDLSHILTVSAHDDHALNLSQGSGHDGLRLYVDGKFMARGGESMIRLNGGPDSYTREISLHDLGYGAHTARIEIEDAAGNETVREISFSYAPSGNRYELAMDRTAVDGRVTFHIEGDAPATARLSVIDRNGIEVYTADVKGGVHVWNACDNNGSPLAPGLYHARMIETGTHQTKGHTNTLDVPVI